MTIFRMIYKLPIVPSLFSSYEGCTMCADGYEYTDDDTETNGECIDCGTDQVDGESASGCAYAYDHCETCGHGVCDGGC